MPCCAYWQAPLQTLHSLVQPPNSSPLSVTLRLTIGPSCKPHLTTRLTLVRVSMWAPRSSKRRTMMMLPRREAMCSGVMPFWIRRRAERKRGERIKQTCAHLKVSTEFLLKLISLQQHRSLPMSSRIITSGFLSCFCTSN